MTADAVTLENETKDQLVVVTIPTLRGATIQDVGLALGRGWGIGKRGIDNGVLLIVAPNDKKVRIEVGYGLEALLQDERAGRLSGTCCLSSAPIDPAQAISLGEMEIIEVLKSDRRRPQYLKKAA